MISRDAPPESLTAEKRRAEVAEILAAGYLRLQVSRASARKGLADGGQREAPCGSQAMNPKSDESAA